MLFVKFVLKLEYFSHAVNIGKEKTNFHVSRIEFTLFVFVIFRIL